MTMDRVMTTVREDRAFLTVLGDTAAAFLQGLLSQAVTKVAPGVACYGALLTPQGKFLHDLFLTAPLDGAPGILLECEAERADDLLLRLKRYRLRAKVELTPVEGLVVGLAWGARPFGLDPRPGHAEMRDGAMLYTDPRLADLGVRVIGPRAAVAGILSGASAPDDRAAYDRLRLSLGVPEGGRDISIDKGFLLESGFDELHGVDWLKGCYVGQELTARTKYRGLVKRRLMPVRIEGPAPEIGAALDFNGKNAGEMRGAEGDVGLALIRLDAWRAAKAAREPIAAGAARLWPEKPDWAAFE